MNILARILSHGFSIAVVILLAIGFIYRGELFPDLEMPAFLARDTDTGTVPVEPATAPEAPVPPAPAVEPVVEAPPVATGTAPEAVVVEEPAEAVAMPPAGEAPPAGDVVTEIAAEAPQEADAVEAPESAVAAEPAMDAQTEVAPEPAGAEPEPVEEVVPPPVEADVAPEPEPGSAEPEPVEEAMPPAVEAAAPEEAAEAVVEEAPVMQPESAPAVVEATEVAGTAPAAEAIPDDMAAEVPSPPEAVQSAAEPPVDEPAQATTDETGTLVIETHVIPATEESAPALTVTETSPYKLLAAAREAYWLHDYEMAEANYRKLAEVEPDNPDGYGELGNMYFSQGKWGEASSAYFEAGVRLVGAGQIQPARDLLNIIRGLNGAQADELEKLISASGQPEGQ